MHGWHQQAMAEEARTIADLGAELYKRVATFGDHMQKIGRNLNTAVGAYNAAIGSLENSVLPQARKMKEHHIQTGGRDIGHPEHIEQVPRDVSRPEITGSDDAYEGVDNPGIADKSAGEG
jgi:DNA recombination protein RmuC